MKRLAVLTAVAVAVLLVASAAHADPTYVGAAKCKMCHKLQYNSWMQTPHAKAFDEVKAKGEEGNAVCLKCHATGASADRPGVQCEACHGPGSAYKSMKIMRDKEAALAAGLVLPDESRCKECHAGKAPHKLKPFDYAKAKQTGLHEMKK